MNVLQAILRTLFYVVVGGLISIVGAAFFFMNWEPDRDDFTVRGIDVSHHLGDIDWPQVAADDVAFVYMKASEGGDFKDSAFARNWAGAGSAGLARGAYHYFSLCQPGRKQAENFLGVLPKDSDMLAPVLDLELTSNCARRPPVEEVLKEISAFTTLVEQAHGKQVIFYAPGDFYEAYLKGSGLNRRLWARSIWHQPDYASDWVIWQYHDRGRVKGVESDVDLNVLQSDTVLEKLKS
ncbi:glycoside hydrolase family 25 protein [Roseibium sediminicola]|uniref:Glycoside hydrolase family 25 protein n=1 Tax=Roseibium sediminicola TaxID=2933272 RepID=A0ABT0GSA7_9HYPH|nr:glycoside hydrolase family 25 protein [Roseibium sp. CAU 1639]MCK7612176.1 glycoside hydrolase family 25 protein [Roseibium sp. CAU 1639]